MKSKRAAEKEAAKLKEPRVDDTAMDTSSDASRWCPRSKAQTT